jgi:hypothetical protein
MSRINDALKRAQQNQPAPSKSSQSSPPLELKMVQQPELVSNRPKPGFSRLLPILVVFLTVAAVAIAGWAARNHSAHTPADALPEPAKTEQPVPALVTSEVSAPKIVPIAASAAAEVRPADHTTKTASVTAPVEPDSAPLVNQRSLPKLQGILYAPGKSSVIIDGRSLRAGDKILEYRVKEISQFTVTLVDAAGKVTKLRMSD